MKCSKCNSQTIVVDVRTREDGVVRRRLQCQQCLNRRTTYELSKDIFKQLEEIEKKYRKITKIIGEW